MCLKKANIVKGLLILPALFVVLAGGESFARRDIVWILCPKGGVVVSSSAGKPEVLLHTHHNDVWTIHHQALPGEEANRIDPRFQFLAPHATY